MNPRRLAPTFTLPGGRVTVQPALWLPLYRVNLDGHTIGLVWRTGGAWYSAPIGDTADQTRRASKDAAVSALLSAHEGAWAA